MDLEGLREKPKKGEVLKDNHMESILKKLYPNKTWIIGKSFKINNNTIKIAGQRYFKPDFYNVELKIVIEIDGDAKTRGNHYSNAKTAIKDKLKDQVYEKYNYKVIRIPPFVQLDSEMVKHYFNITYTEPLYEVASEHGFKHPNITLPADFCELGIKRFEKELSELPQTVRDVIVETLVYRINCEIEKGSAKEDALSIVLPKSLYGLVENKIK